MLFLPFLVSASNLLRCHKKCGSSWLTMFRVRDAVLAKVSRALPANVISSDLTVFATRTAYEAKQALDPRLSLHDLAANDTLIVEVPKREGGVPPVQLFHNGVNPHAPHLMRAELLDRVYKSMQHRFILFLSPAASGKTSLLALIAAKYPHLNCIPVSFLRTEISAVNLLQSCEIDLYGRKTKLSEHQNHVVMIDDAQVKYDDKDFWTALIKVAPSWLPDNVRFIICATHALDGGIESPVEFQSLLKFGRSDFLLRDKEAEEFLELPSTTGLPENMKKRTLTQLLIRECGGLIGALRVSVDSVVTFFSKDPTPSETELIAYYLSQDCLQQMARCFGSKHTTPTTLALQQFLIECLVVAPNVVSLESKLGDEDNRCFLTLKKAGIVVEDVDQLVRFSSPLAEKYYCKWLFPNRAVANPSSLRELITKAIGDMSASVLRQSLVDETSFPKEATFQHQFMGGLALNTHRTCSICPELSRVFPSSSTDGDQPSKIDAEIDFYLNGSLRWGLELLVNGDKIGEHISRFGPDGKYAVLAVKDYAVIDFRRSNTGNITGVTRKEKRVTVFFQRGDFSKCLCIFGMDRTIYDIPLKSGKIMQVGPHGNLLKDEEGLYYCLCKMQELQATSLNNVENNVFELPKFHMLDMFKLSMPEIRYFYAGMVNAALGGFALPGSSLLVSNAMASMTEKYALYQQTLVEGNLEDLYDQARSTEAEKRDAVSDLLAVPGAQSSERLSNIRTVKSLGLGENSTDQFAELLEEPLRKGRGQAQINAVALGFASFIMMAVYALAFCVVGGATYLSESKAASKARAKIFSFVNRDVPIDAFKQDAVFRRIQDPVKKEASRNCPCILKDPAILLLDEATRSFDWESEALVQVALDKVVAPKRCTTVIITHRLSTIRKGDKICVVSCGNITKQGTHDELLAKNGLYAGLVASAYV
ncbi:hypothetical protein Poli38472_002775 [Pythium oligandrum]|uniref:Uncharacterized protein n=1 Tax=Pythium oligandrum TaxID=41045 RepID=A0A8K1CHS8_PYTOL|nr:hypothetical protein Poli38472_002775 [Pythium oligandrum]|eukprot:TMW63834.1 hypothetical protein Poli38472_002775 [Pythium oligandrum]